MPLIDSHLHIWRRDQPLTDTAWHRPPADALVQDCLATLDRHGVIFAVVAAASIHGEYNDYVRAALKAHPRLRATATLDPRTGIHQMEQMKAEGFVGVRLMLQFTDDAPALNGDLRMHLRRCADLGWHVHILDQPGRIARTIEAVEESGARLVVDHMALMQTPEGIDHPGFRAVLAAIERGRTWVKISGRFRFNPPAEADPYAAAILKAGGTDRVLWGSDWPFAGFEGRVDYGGVLHDYYGLVPDAETRRRIDETALRFYFC